MRAFFFLLVILVTTSHVAWAQGFGGGNGGDPHSTDFRTVGYAIATFLEGNPRLYPEIDRVRFRDAVLRVTIAVMDTDRVSCSMTVTDSEGTFELSEQRCSCNYPLAMRIETGTCFAAILSERQRIQHVAHEIIPLTGVSDRDEVKSIAIARRMTERTSLIGIPDVGLGSAFAEDHDDDGAFTGHRAGGSVHLGVGGAVMADDGSAGTTVGGSPAATLHAYGFIRHRRSDGPDPALWPFMAATGEVSAAVAMAADRPVYRVTVDVAGSLVPVVGLWVRVDAAEYAALQADGTITTRGDRVLAAGVPLTTFPIMLGGRNFMWIRVNMGAGGVEAPGTGLTEGRATYAGALALLIRHADYFIHVDAAAHVGSEFSSPTPGRLGSRVSVRAALSYTLRLLFPSDAIRLEANFVNYEIREMPSVTHYDLGLYYEMRF